MKETAKKKNGAGTFLPQNSTPITFQKKVKCRKSMGRKIKHKNAQGW